MHRKPRRVKTDTGLIAQYGHRIPKQGIGITILVAFLLVSALFVFLYLHSDPLPDADLSADYAGAGTDVLGENAKQSLKQPSEQTDIDADAGSSADSQTGFPQGEPIIKIIGTAYLTFDDGPSRALTPGILDVLADEEVKATFFTLPREDVEDIFWRIIDEGHEIGNHTFSHDYDALFKGNVSAFKEDVLKARRYIEDRYGYSTTAFRFPAGTMTWSKDIRNPRIDVINELGYKYFDWHIDSGDALQNIDAETITANILDNTHAREHVIILMHDYFSRETTLEALPMVIDGLRLQGYEFDILKNYP